MLFAVLSNLCISGGMGGSRGPWPLQTVILPIANNSVKNLFTSKRQLCPPQSPALDPPLSKGNADTLDSHGCSKTGPILSFCAKLCKIPDPPDFCHL